MLNMAAVAACELLDCVSWGTGEIEPWLLLIGGKVLSSREMDCEFNLEWKLIPLPCAWAAFLPVGEGERERVSEGGKWRNRNGGGHRRWAEREEIVRKETGGRENGESVRKKAKRHSLCD